MKYTYILGKTIDFSINLTTVYTAVTKVASYDKEVHYTVKWMTKGNKYPPKPLRLDALNLYICKN